MAGVASRGMLPSWHAPDHIVVSLLLSAAIPRPRREADAVNPDEELKAIDDQLAKLACSDGGCSIRVPRGMHTNGGCHCLGDTRNDWSPELRATIRHALQLRQRQVALLTEGKRTP